MNILLFLTPKKDVSYIYEDFTVRQALEKMEFHRYSAIPIISRDGKYVGTLTEGDLLWYIKNVHCLNITDVEDDKLIDVPRLHDNKAVPATSDLSDIFSAAIDQNFIPVIDDNNIFIGIITRKNIFNHLSSFQ